MRLPPFARVPLIGPLLAAATAIAAGAQDPAGLQVRRAAPAGADVVVIVPDSLPDLPRTMSELLASRVPGLLVQRSSGAAGAGSWLSLRDAGAVTADDPLVVVDGIRRVPSLMSIVWQDSERLAPSALDDIAIETVERVEVLRGPAAAARYGHDALHGVIVVTTRPPGNGPLRFRASVTAGVASQEAEFPLNHSRYDSRGFACPLYAEVGGRCSAVGTSAYTPLRQSGAFQNGARRGLAGSVTGGLGALGYSVGASHERAAGMFDRDGYDRTSATARFEVPLAPQVRFSLAGQTAFRGVSQPAQGRSFLEPLAGGIVAGPLDCSPRTPCGDDVTSRGYRFGTPKLLGELGIRHRLQHFTQGAALDADPFPWLALNTTVSFDAAADRSRQENPPITKSSTPYGFAEATTRVSRLGIGQTFSARRATSGASWTTIFTLRYDRARTHATKASYLFLDTQGGRLASTSGSLTRLKERRASARLEQRASPTRRLDLGAGALFTASKLSARGNETPNTLDAFGDLSLRLVDGAGRSGALQSLRLRAAAAQVSMHDPSDDLLYGFTPLLCCTPGPSRPDRRLEIEAGADATARPGTAAVGFTLFRRAESTRSMPRIGPPGASGPLLLPTTMHRQVEGMEVSAGLTLLDLERVAWRVQGHVAFNRDEVTSYDAPPFFVGVGSGAIPMVREGKSFAQWYVAPYTWNDSNGDGILVAGEMSRSGGLAEAGRARPSWMAALANTISLGRMVTVGAQADYVGGHQVVDVATAMQCRFDLCAPLNRPGTPLAEQARALNARSSARPTGYLQSGSAMRLRELSASFRPPRLAGLAGATSFTVTAAARNLATWTAYGGLDPEIDMITPGTEDVYGGLYLPQTRQFLLRLTLAY